MKNRRAWKLALVTGAASGIGLCYCKELAAQGVALVMVDRNPMEEAVAALGPKARCRTLRLDLTDPDAVDRLMDYLGQERLCPDLLINNAGIFDFDEVVNIPERRIALYIDLHVRAVTMLTRRMAMMMATGGGGSILNMSSMSCWMPMPGIAMYSATKAYIRTFSRAIAVELSGTGVSVTVACPGGIATDLFGLPRSLQRLGVRLGVLMTPDRLVRKALMAAAKGRRQYINGWLNRIAIVAVGGMPDWARIFVKNSILSRYGATVRAEK